MKKKLSKLSDSELQKQLSALGKEVAKRSGKTKQSKAKVLTINGITAKDICVFYSPLDHDDSSFYFSFYVKHDGKVYDFYYDHSTYDTKHVKSFHPWWPIKVEEEEDWDKNGAFDFIPDGFGEAMENCYEFYGPVKKAIAQLKKHGITDVREGNPHDIGETGNAEGDGVKL